MLISWNGNTFHITVPFEGGNHWSDKFSTLKIKNAHQACKATLWGFFVVSLDKGWNEQLSCLWFETHWWMMHCFHSCNIRRNRLFRNELYITSYVFRSHIVGVFFYEPYSFAYTFCVIGSPWYLFEQWIPSWCYSCINFCQNNVCTCLPVEAFVAFRGQACGVGCHSMAIDLLNSFDVSKPSTL